MTRQEFIDDVNTIWELLRVAVDYDYEFDDVYSGEQYNDEVNEQLSYDDRSWRDIRDCLDNLPDGYDFYIRNRWGEWEGRGEDDIDDLKAQFLTWADDDGEIFEEEEDDEEYNEESPDDSEPEVEDPEPEPDFTLDDILSVIWDNSERTA